jgi:hypothetical protein
MVDGDDGSDHRQIIFSGVEVFELDTTDDFLL